MKSGRYGISLVCAFLFTCVSLQAAIYEWGNQRTGSSAVWDGNSAGTLIADTATVGPLKAGVFEAKAADTLRLKNTVRLNGTIEINFAGTRHPVTGLSTPTTPENFVVELGTGGDDAVASNHVFIKPNVDATTGPLKTAQLIFNPAQGKTIEVQVKNSTWFCEANGAPFFISFKGLGTTKFRLPGGRVLAFCAESQNACVAGTYPRFLMNDGGQGSQVLFERWNQGTRVDSIDDSARDVTIRFGAESEALRFESRQDTLSIYKANNGSSWVYQGVQTTVQDPAGSGTQSGQSTVIFNAASSGVGAIAIDSSFDGLSKAYLVDPSSLRASFVYEWGNPFVSGAAGLWNGDIAGELITDTVNVGPLKEGVFEAKAADTLRLKNTVRLNGNVEINFAGTKDPVTGASTPNTPETFVVELGTGANDAVASNHVFIKPNVDATTGPVKTAQLTFNPAQGKTIEVQVKNSTWFSEAHGAPLFISFKGLGTTKFRLPGGRVLAFCAESQDACIAGTYPRFLANQGDQGSRVLFERWNQGMAADSIDDLARDVTIRLGAAEAVLQLVHDQGSVWTSAHNNRRSWVNQGVPTTVQDPAGTAVQSGQGTITFNAASRGAGAIALEYSFENSSHEVYLVDSARPPRPTLYEWGNAGVGSSTLWNGNAAGHLISDTLSAGPLKSGVFEAKAADTLRIKNTVRLNGNVEINFAGTPNTPETFVVELGAGGDDGISSNHVFIKPNVDATAGPVKTAQLTFNPAQGKTIEVQVKNSTWFSEANGAPLFISFKGLGTTKFRLPGGRVLAFCAESQNACVAGTYPRFLSNQGGQGSRVLFERWNQGVDADSIDDPVSDVTIRFGAVNAILNLQPHQGSVWSSEHSNGRSWVNQGVQTTVQDPAGTALQSGQGVITFNAASRGVGVLTIDYSFNNDSRQVYLVDASLPARPTVYEWGNAGVGSSAVWNGSAAGYLISDTVTMGPLKAGVFEAKVADTLRIKNTVRLNGNVEINFAGTRDPVTGASTPNTPETFVVELGTGGDDGISNNHVFIKPNVDATAGPVKTAQLTFNPAEGKTIEVQVKNSTWFSEANGAPLFISFKGLGTTKFRLPGGRVLAFSAESKDACVAGTYPRFLANQGGQGSRVLFERWNQGMAADSIDDPVSDVTIRLGAAEAVLQLVHDQGSVWTSAHNNRRSWVNQGVQTTVQDPAGTAVQSGQGTITFNAANSGAGAIALEYSFESSSRQVYLVDSARSPRPALYEWGNAGVGSSTLWNGNAAGNLISDTLSAGPLKSGVFEAKAADTLRIKNTVRLNGNIEINFAGTPNTPETFVVELGAGGDDGISSNHVFIKPNVDATAGPVKTAQLTFNPAQGKTIEVQVKNSTWFSEAHGAPLFISFKGLGTTKFRLPGGRVLAFCAESRDACVAGTYTRFLANQDDQDSRVLFERWNQGVDADTIDDSASDVTIRFGEADAVLQLVHDQGSVWLSEHSTGRSWVNQGVQTTVQDPAGTAVQSGQGVITFNAAHTGVGVLTIDYSFESGSRQVYLSNASLRTSFLYEWGNPVSGSALPLWDGNSEGSLITDALTAGPLKSGVFEAKAADTLRIKNTVRLNGNVEINFAGTKNPVTGASTPNTPETFVVELGTGANDAVASNHVFIKPNVDSTTGPVKTAQLTFNPAQGKTIEVQVKNSTWFSEANGAPLFISFKGLGITKFRLPGGRVLAFSAESQAASVAGTYTRFLMNEGGQGAHVMFERWNQGMAADGIDDPARDVTIRLGAEALALAFQSHVGNIWTYKASNGRSWAYTTANTTVQDPAGSGAQSGYGVVTMNAASKGAGVIAIDYSFHGSNQVYVVDPTFVSEPNQANPVFPSGAAVYEWGNRRSGPSVLWDGNAEGAHITDTLNAGPLVAGVFYARAIDTLRLKNTVKLTGDIEINFEGIKDPLTGAGTPNTPETFVIELGTGADDALASNHVFIKPDVDGTIDSKEVGHLIFNPAEGKTIEVQVKNSTWFSGTDAVSNYCSDLPLYVSFRGRGTTRFRLPGGRVLAFCAESEGTYTDVNNNKIQEYGAEIGADGYLSVVGTHVRVLMDQTSTDAIINRVPQVVFERWDYDGSDDINNTESDVVIRLGQRSTWTYLSMNVRSLIEAYVDKNGNSVQDPGEIVTLPGYGTVAFDPSNAGSGRMIFDVARGQEAKGNDFTDGAFNLCGCLVTPSGFAYVPNHYDKDGKVTEYIQVQTPTNADLRDLFIPRNENIVGSTNALSVSYNQRAGIQAIMRITDGVAYNALVPNGTDAEIAAWVARGAEHRRGLLVICRNNTIPCWSSNFEDADSIDGSNWAYMNMCQPGWIMGNNGWLEIGHNLFLDYVAANYGQELTHKQDINYGQSLTQNQDRSVVSNPFITHTAEVTKFHNPAALYVDGLARYRNYSARQPDQWGCPILDMRYEDSDLPAQITLRGNGMLAVRTAHSTPGNALLVDPAYRVRRRNAIIDGTEVMSYDYVYLGIGAYDGKAVNVLAADRSPALQSTHPEGEHALDVEGPLLIESLPGIDKQPAAGVLTVPSVRIDYTGRESGYKDFWNDLSFQPKTVTRPLTIGEYYPVYNVSSILVNAHCTLRGVTLSHSDVTRASVVIGQGGVTEGATLGVSGDASRPALIGGERAYLVGDAFPPALFLENATLELHESLVVSGVTFAVANCAIAPGDTPHKADNVSRLVCYNRGSRLDAQGIGRYLQLGSGGNVSADGSTDEFLRSAFLRVYRADPTPGATNLDPTRIEFVCTEAFENGVATTHRVNHCLYLANESTISLGWPTIEGDLAYTPWTIDDGVYKQLLVIDPANRAKFRFDPASTGQGVLRFLTPSYCIGAGSALDNKPPRIPIPGMDVGGVLYVDYGGAIRVEGTGDLICDTVIAQRLSSTDSLLGALSLPPDQVDFGRLGAFQVYQADFATTGVNGRIHLAGKSDELVVSVSQAKNMR